MLIFKHMNNSDIEQDNQAPDLKLIDIQWPAPEFKKHEKGLLWFIIVGIIGLSIFTLALITKNFIFAAMIILAVFTIFIYALKEPLADKF